MATTQEQLLEERLCVRPVPNPDRGRHFAPGRFAGPPFLAGFRVKCMNFPQPGHLRPYFPDATLDQLALALDWAWEEVYDRFWEAAEMIADETYASSVVASGSDGMTLAVLDLGDYRQWNPADFAQWHEFQHNILAELEYLTSLDKVVQLIHEKQWVGAVSRGYCHARAS